MADEITTSQTTPQRPPAARIRHPVPLRTPLPETAIQFIQKRAGVFERASAPEANELHYQSMVRMSIPLHRMRRILEQNSLPDIAQQSPAEIECSLQTVHEQWDTIAAIYNGASLRMLNTAGPEYTPPATYGDLVTRMDAACAEVKEELAAVPQLNADLVKLTARAYEWQLHNVKMTCAQLTRQTLAR